MVHFVGDYSYFTYSFLALETEFRSSKRLNKNVC
jgi:hypothetical protein